MYDDPSRPTAEPLALDDAEQSNCRLSLLASALSGYPVFADGLLAPPGSVTDLSSQLEGYTLQPEKRNGTDEHSAPSSASLGQTESSEKSSPIVLLHRQSIIRRHRKSDNFFQMHRRIEVLLSDEQPSDEPGFVHPSLTSYPRGARFFVLPDQPPICKPDPSAQAVEAENANPGTCNYNQIKTSGHERMCGPLGKPHRQNLVLKSIRCRKSAERKRSHRRKRSAACEK